MPARVPALCTRLLFTGKTCAQPALRGEPFCRFHNDDRARANAEHDERMFALEDELDTITIYQLLQTVHNKLYNIGSVVRAFGEAKLAVIVALHRLAQLNSEDFQITRIPPNPRPAVKVRMQAPINSTTAPQLPQNQRPPVTRIDSPM